MLGVGETQYVERKPFFLPQIDVRFVSNLVHTREKAHLRRFFLAYRCSIPIRVSAKFIGLF